MATITATLANTHGSSSRGRQPYYVQQIVDLTANSINPNGDVVQCLTVPANTKIIAAGFQVTTSATMNTGTDATAALGTGADDNEYVTAFDIDGASDGAYAPSVTVSADLVITSDDTLDLTLAGSGASFSAGKIRVYAVLQDVSDIGEMEADEVGRDQLA
mgnify:FL=1|jgi:hypothetical protein|tara:strand:- start:613 stop:1092 length:480 start_codon:yes stop_codon:yes gene_type:complete